MLDLSGVWPEWTAVEELGEGSYGKVYKCVREERGIRSECAVKAITIPRSKADVDGLLLDGLSVEASRSYFSEIVDDFANEIRVMEELKGAPGIVAIEDYKIVERTDRIGWDIYIRMELLTPFKEYAQTHEITQQDVVTMALQLCEAMEICSAQNILHRDIKPENIFVDRYNKFKLGDFGVAKQIEKTMGASTKKGTYSYMAPEVNRGEHYDIRADIYSLGMVMYRLLNNNRDPFVDPQQQMVSYRQRAAAMQRRFAGEQLPGPLYADADLARIILKCCAFDPKERYDSFEALAKALNTMGSSHGSTAIETEQTISESPTLKQEKWANRLPKKEILTENIETPPKRSRRKFLIATVSLVLVAAIVIGIVLINKHKKAESEENDTASAGQTTTGQANDLIEFGSYPQSEVEDSELVSKLNNQTVEWQSYGYYSGTGNGSGNGKDGKMTASGYMQFADTSFDGERYRGVKFTDFRPGNTTDFISAASYSQQSANGYDCDTIYWFRYDPLEWHVLDKNSGLVICETVIDSQPINNYIVEVDEECFGDKSRTFYANNYAESSIREWLNNEFYNTAFTLEQQEQIQTTSLDNCAYSQEYSQYDSASTTDKVFLLSWDDAMNTEYGFVNNDLAEDSERKAKGSDYAKCQGLISISESLYSPWWLRSAGYVSERVCGVGDEGWICDGDTTFGSYDVSRTDFGIRPAMRVNLSFDETKTTTSVIDVLSNNTNQDNADTEDLLDPSIRRTGYIAAAWDYTIGIRSDGTVISTKCTDPESSAPDVSNWKNIIAVSANTWHAVGLHSNGTVTVSGDNENGRCNVNGWNNIVAISSGNWHTVGVRSDGTVIATGDSEDGECDVADWKNIIDVAAGASHTVGLQSDGTVVATGYNYYGQCNVDHWTDIVAIAAGDNYTVGLRSDGTVVVTDFLDSEVYEGQCDVEHWNNIVALAAGQDHTVGLRSDGTVVATGRNWQGQCNVSDWDNIVAIAAGTNYTVGLRSDGTVVATEFSKDYNDIYYGQCDVDDWKDMKLPE